MIINKKFEILLEIMQTPGLARKLMGPKFKIPAMDVVDIKCNDTEITCVYMPDSRYKFNFKFIKTDNGEIEFSVSQASSSWILVMGIIVGIFMFIKIGFFGLFFGLGLYLLFSFGYVYYYRYTVSERISKRIDNIKNEITAKD